MSVLSKIGHQSGIGRRLLGVGALCLFLVPSPGAAKGPLEAAVDAAMAELKAAETAAAEGEDWRAPLIADGESPDATPRQATLAGYLLQQAGDHAGACALYRRAAEAGLMLAQHSLGECLVHGRIEGDGAEIERWYRAAMEQGSLVSQCALGELLIEGRLLPQDVDRGLSLCQAAAEGGSLNAKLTMGDEAVRAERFDLATRWYQEAMEGGLPNGAFKLGVLLRQGRYQAADMAEIARIAEAAGLAKHPDAFRLASDLYSDHLFESFEQVEDKLNGPYGFRAYYWILLTYFMHPDEQVKDLADKRMAVIVQTVGDARIKEWYARAREEATGG